MKFIMKMMKIMVTSMAIISENVLVELQDIGILLQDPTEENFPQIKIH